jgi:Flp pilus assembly pilin Flp
VLGRTATSARSLVADTSGATAVEYAVMTFIAIAIEAAISMLGARSPPCDQLKGLFGTS